MVLVSANVALATPTAETSLNNCQNAVKTATAAFVKNKVAAIGTCLQAVSTQIVKNNAADASGAAAHLRHAVPQDQRQPQPGQAAERQAGRGDHQEVHAPAAANYAHALADIIGAGAGVPQPLNAENLNAWCSHYGGDGSIDTPAGVDRLHHRRGGVRCGLGHRQPVPARARVAEPREAVDAGALAAGTPTPPRSADAVAGLDAVKAEIDGPDNDNVVSIQCGGIVSTGTAVASNCLAGTTFSNGTAGGVTGTMPNNGAVTLTPSTTDQTIALGYHNGSGKCVGDADLVSGNIKSGVNLFGVDGSSAVVDTSGATATATDMLSGKTAYVNGSLVTGSVPAGAT